MTREEAITVLKTLMKNPLFSEVHKVAFNIAIHDIKQRHDWDINNLILINKDDYEPLEQEPCEDAVSRKSVITIIQNHWWNCRDIDKLVNGLPSITPQEPKWIPVSEKKPNKGGEYLLWGKIDESEEEDYCFIGDYYEFEEKFGTEISNYDPNTLGFIDTEIEEYYSVVAWMPLPKPYKEVEE